MTAEFTKDLTYGQEAEVKVIERLRSTGHAVQYIDNQQRGDDGDIKVKLGDRWKIIEVKRQKLISKQNKIIVELTGRSCTGWGWFTKPNYRTDIIWFINHELTESYIFDYPALHQFYAENYLHIDQWSDRDGKRCASISIDELINWYTANKIPYQIIKTEGQD